MSRGIFGFVLMGYYLGSNSTVDLARSIVVWYSS